MLDACYSTAVAVKPGMRLWREEVFGPIPSNAL
jgi:acyl-CoA reductase-like NAD-dependent aldehyde dehydrogenase